jgi:hypothetical protein
MVLVERWCFACVDGTRLRLPAMRCRMKMPLRGHVRSGHRRERASARIASIADHIKVARNIDAASG